MDDKTKQLYDAIEASADFKGLFATPEEMISTLDKDPNAFFNAINSSADFKDVFANVDEFTNAIGHKKKEAADFLPSVGNLQKDYQERTEFSAIPSEVTTEVKPLQPEIKKEKLTPRLQEVQDKHPDLWVSSLTYDKTLPNDITLGSLDSYANKKSALYEKQGTDVLDKFEADIAKLKTTTETQEEFDVAAKKLQTAAGKQLDSLEDEFYTYKYLHPDHVAQVKEEVDKIIQYPGATTEDKLSSLKELREYFKNLYKDGNPAGVEGELNAIIGRRSLLFGSQPTEFAIKSHAVETRNKLRDVKDKYQKEYLAKFELPQTDENGMQMFASPEQQEAYIKATDKIDKIDFAINNLDRAINVPEAKEGAGKEAFKNELGNIASAGLAGLIETGVVAGAAQRQSKGTASEADVAVVDAYGQLKQLEGIASQEVDRYRRAKSIAGSIPYMEQFVLTAGIGKVAVEAGEKAAATIIKNKLKNKILKGVTKFAAERLVSPAVEGTVSMLGRVPLSPTTYQNILDARTPIKMEDGKYVVDTESMPGVIDAINQGVKKSGAEIFTESLGGTIALPKSKIINKILSPAVQRVFRTVGLNNPFGEYVEEIYNNLLVGDKVDKEFLTDLLWTIAPMTGGYALLASTKAVPAMRWRAESKALIDKFGRDNVAEIRTLIESGDKEGLVNKVNDLITSTETSKDEVLNLVEYAGSLVQESVMKEMAKEPEVPEVETAAKAASAETGTAIDEANKIIADIKSEVGGAVAGEQKPAEIMATPTDQTEENKGETIQKEPQVYLTKEDVEEKTSFGETYTTTKDGEQLRGSVIEKTELPTEVYHVTTAKSAVDKSGMIKHMPAKTGQVGLGKGTSKGHWGVSITTDVNDASIIEREIRRAVELAQDKDANGEELLRKYAKEDSEKSGVDLTKVVESAIENYKFHKEQGETYAAFQDFKGYLAARERAGGDVNPILFGQGEAFAKIDPNEIATLKINSANIPDAALIRKDPISKDFMHEVMVHSDIPITKITEETKNAESTGVKVEKAGEQAQGLVEGEEGGLRVRNAEENRVETQPGEEVKTEKHHQAIYDVLTELNARAPKAKAIHVVKDQAELPEEVLQEVQKQFGSGATVRAYIIAAHDKNGKVWFVTDNIKDTGDAIALWIHEQGIHQGLRTIMPEAELNKLLMKVYNDIGFSKMSKVVPSIYTQAVLQGKLSKQKYAEEYIAHLAEKVVTKQELTQAEKSIWQEIVDFVRNALGSIIKSKTPLTDKDIANIIHASVGSLFERSVSENEQAALSNDISTSIGDPISFSAKPTLKGEPVTVRKGYAQSLVTKSDLIDIESLIKDIEAKGQKVWFWMADQLGRGYYYDTVLGKWHYLDAGPSYALDPKNKKTGEIWASGGKLKELRDKAKEADYIFIISGSPTASHGFNKTVFDLQQKRIETVGSYRDFKRDVLAISRVSGINNILNKHDSFESLRDDDERKDLFEALTEETTKKTPLAEVLRKYNALIDLDALRDDFYRENNFGQGDVMMVLKPESAEEGSSHSTYLNRILGKVIGVPNKRINAASLVLANGKDINMQVQAIAPYAGKVQKITVRNVSPKRAELIAAPFFNTQVSSIEEADKLRESKVYKDHINNIKKVCRAFGVRVVEITKNTGGYVNEATGEKIVEISNTIVIEGDYKTAQKIAAVLGATTPDVQETTIAGHYVKAGSPNHGSDEHSIHVNKFSEALKILKELGIDEFTIDESNKRIKFLDFSKGKNLDFKKNFITFVNTLKEKGIKYGDEKKKATESVLINAEDRRAIMGGLNERSVQRGGSWEILRDITEGATQRNENFITESGRGGESVSFAAEVEDSETVAPLPRPTSKALAIPDKPVSIDDITVRIRKSQDRVREQLNLKSQEHFSGFTDPISRLNTELWKKTSYSRDVMANVIAKGLQAGMTSQVDATRWVSKFITDWYGGLGRTQADIMAKLRMVGTAREYAGIRANQLSNKLYAIINGDGEALTRVWRVLDPEMAKEGGTQLTYNDLTASEQALFNALRELNTLIHESNYAMGFLRPVTYEKFKDENGNVIYIAREYDRAGLLNLTDKEMASYMDKGQNASGSEWNKKVGKLFMGMFKARKELTDKMKENAITDPVYLTVKRVRQTIQNTAIKGYMDYVIKTHPNFVRDVAPGELTPKGFTQLSDSFSWGPFRGKAVANHIVEDLVGFYYSTKVINDIYDALKGIDRSWMVQFYKKWHTVYNPFVQLGNFTGNMFFASIAGINPVELAAMMPQAYKDARDLTEEYMDVLMTGVMGATGITGDLTPITSENSSTIKTVSKSENILKRAVGMFGKMDKATSELYQGSDNIAKYAAYKIFRKHGLTHEQSVRRVYDSFQNYATVGKIWDVASKLPFIGPKFVKFQADLQRILLNGISTSPMTTVGTLLLINAVGNITSMLSGEDDDEKKIREERRGVPSIPIPWGDPVPLVFKIGSAEINVARYLSPLYVYNYGDEGIGITELSKFLPIQVQKGPEGRTVPAFQDPVLGWLAQLAFDYDWQGNSIKDPNASTYLPVKTPDYVMRQNRLTYIARSEIPFYRTAQDMYDGFTGNLDYYGRKRTWQQTILNNIIKIQEFDDPQLVALMERNVNGLTNRFAGLSNMMGNASVRCDQTINAAEKRGVTGSALDKIKIDAFKQRGASIDLSIKEQNDVQKELERLVKVYAKWFPDITSIEDYEGIKAGMSRRFNVMDGIDLQKKYPDKYELLKKNDLLIRPEVPKYYITGGDNIKLNPEQQQEYMRVYWTEYIQELDYMNCLTQEEIDADKQITGETTASTQVEEGFESGTLLSIKASNARAMAKARADNKLSDIMKNQK
jgi:hypothetical protein